MPNDTTKFAAGARIPVKLHRRVCLIQTEDALLAEELLARKKLAQDIVGRLTECVLLVRPALTVAHWCRAFDTRGIDTAVDATARATFEVYREAAGG